MAVRLAYRTGRDTVRDGVLGLSAQVAFWAMLSLPPLLLGLLGLVGVVAEAIGPDATERVRDVILDITRQAVTPRTARDVIEPLVDRVLAGGRADLASLGFLMSFWSGSAAMNAYIRAIVIAYDLEGLRKVWVDRLLALVLNLGALVVAVLLLPLFAIGPDVLADILPEALTPESSVLVDIGYWATIMMLSVFALATLYHVAVPARTPWRRDLPGAVLGMVLWVGGSLALRTYLTSDLRSGDYGPLAAPIATLLFFYVAALAVLVGAELNAEIDKMWPSEETARVREGARHKAASGKVTET